MMKQSFTILLVLLISMISTKALAYDIAVKNSDGVTFYYKYINDGNELELVQHATYSGNVVIPEKVTYMGRTLKVTSIGCGAFFQCSGLISISIPNSVTSIGARAFSCCSSLIAVTIPNSVTSIDSSAFVYCSGLTSVTIGNSVLRIGDSAFENCYSLKSVTIPNSVTSIGCHAFSNCGSLASISVASGNTKYDSRENCNAIIETATNTLISGCKSTIIPNSVTSIGKVAFYNCSSLKSITIPKSVTSIGDLAFSGCSCLAYVSVASGNTIYDSRDNCNAIIETATNTMICGCKNTIIPNSVTSIGNDAFYGCSDLSSVIIPNSVTNIGLDAFGNCPNLTSVIVKWETPINIGSFAHPFSNQKNAMLYVPSGCKTSYMAANYWKEFKEIVEKVDANGKCGDNLIWTYVEATGTLTISGSGTMYDYYSSGAPWYSYRKNLKTAVIEDGVTSIGENAFRECSGLTSVTIPNSVTSIKGYAFSRCSGLTSITIPNSVTSIGLGAFSFCSCLTSITIPNSVTSIGSNAFYHCSGLTSVTIPNSVTSIGVRLFSGCSGLTSIKVESSNKKYDSRNNCNAVIETSTNELISGCNNTNIPNSVTSIGESAFFHCSGLTSITIPNSVTSIGVCAFDGCSGLTSITIPNSVTSIGSYAFYDCSGLTSVTIPNSVTSIEEYTFQNCSSLTSITIPNSVTSIGSYAFYNCNRLTSVTIPSSVTSIGLGAFSYCSCLTSITIPNSVTGIGNYAFGYCSGLTSITIPSSVTGIGNYAFGYCSGLTSITIPSSVTSIGNYAFEDCSNLTNVIVKMKTPVSIYSNTFSNRKNATLFVPYGCKAAYMAAIYWKEFKEIVEAENVVEVTDISKMTNAIYAEPSSGRVGEEVSIKVCMKNANAATSYGFELVLPQGLSIATTSGGDFDAAVTMSTRHKGHTLTTNKLANNTYKVGVASLSSKALTDNDGLVLTIKAHVADNMAVGDYPILIQNPLIVNTDGTKPAVQNTQSKITIEDYKKGDVDGDGVVDLADAVLVINHYVGKPVNKFVAKAADVDGDGVIDLADAVRIINFYVGKVQSLAPRHKLNGLDPQ